jgi:hypothetical protein
VKKGIFFQMFFRKLFDMFVTGTSDLGIGNYSFVLVPVMCSLFCLLRREWSSHAVCVCVSLMLRLLRLVPRHKKTKLESLNYLLNAEAFP